MLSVFEFRCIYVCVDAWKHAFRLICSCIQYACVVYVFNNNIMLQMAV